MRWTANEVASMTRGCAIYIMTHDESASEVLRLGDHDLTGVPAAAGDGEESWWGQLGMIRPDQAGQ